MDLGTKKVGLGTGLVLHLSLCSVHYREGVEKHPQSQNRPLDNRVDLVV